MNKINERYGFNSLNGAINTIMFKYNYLASILFQFLKWCD